MNDNYFIDTNIFVYSFSPDFPKKQKIARNIIGSALDSHKGHISYQVVQEFINVTQKKYKHIFLSSDLNEYLTQILMPICSVFPSSDLYQKSLEISKKTQYSFYDSLIIASAIQAEAKILYSEDLHHGQTIERLQIQNPFLLLK